MKIVNPKSVEFVESRWHVEIVVTGEDGTVQRFRASADHFLESNGIWFGTEDEYREAGGL